MMRYILLLFLTLNIYAANAKLIIEKDVDQRSRIAIVDGSVESSVLREKVHGLFLSDLKVSGHFLPEKSYRTGDFTTGVIAPDLRGQEHVIKYSLGEDKGYTVLLIKLLKASDSTLLLEKKYAIGSSEKYPFLVHKAVVDINDALGYRSVKWLSKYVVYGRYIGAKKSEIVLADYTFSYEKVIIKGGYNLFPHWADVGRKSIYYTNYDSTYPTLYRLNIYTGERQKLVSSDGMLVCSDVSSDGDRLLLTMGPDGQADIFEYTVSSKTKKQLTTFSGVDVNGKYVDGDRAIVFVSDRMGSANVYKKMIASSGVSGIIHHGKSNSAVDATDTRIVYSSKEGRGLYNIYLTNTTGDGTRPLTSGGLNQSPHFSSDGNIIMYIKRIERSNSVGYINLSSNQTVLFPLGERKIQSFDW